MRKKNQVVEGDTYGNLQVKWCWNTKSSDRVWKCACLRCNATIYVRESGLLLGLVKNCDCDNNDKRVEK